ncbi:hypothetical protein LTR85_001118 [Meristemomyces frigidus]|nr:hypothetical protein LTR85_001118 [Meristemomyces frigidus]
MDHDDFAPNMDSGETTVEFACAVAKEMHRLLTSNLNKRIQNVFKGPVSEKPDCHYHQHDATHPFCDDGSDSGKSDDEKPK